MRARRVAVPPRCTAQPTRRRKSPPPSNAPLPNPRRVADLPATRRSVAAGRAVSDGTPPPARDALPATVAPNRPPRSSDRLILVEGRYLVAETIFARRPATMDAIDRHVHRLLTMSTFPLRPGTDDTASFKARLSALATV